MVQIMTYVSDEVYRKISDDAREKGQSISAVNRGILERHYKVKRT